jgi:hypothetical protein
MRTDGHGCPFLLDSKRTKRRGHPRRFAQIGPTNVADGQHGVRYHPIDVDGHAWLLLKMGQLHEVFNDVAGALGVTIDNGGVFTRFGVEHFAASRKDQLSARENYLQRIVEIVCNAGGNRSERRDGFDSAPSKEGTPPGYGSITATLERWLPLSYGPAGSNVTDSISIH